MVDAFYTSGAWRRLRLAVLRRDGFKCTTPGCGAVAKIVDHIVSPANGGADTMGNLRSLCRRCDNLVKEGSDGRRRGGGTPYAVGCDADGNPRDPNNAWYRR